MNLRLWDFQCDACGHRYNGEPITAAKTPKTIKCRQEGCKGRASWASGGKQNHIHETNSRLGYGKFDPQFGCVVESYSHKKKLMRQMGLMEKKHYSLEEIKEEQYYGERAKREDVSKHVVSAEELDEVYAQIEQQAGKSARRGELQESWGEL